MDWSRKGLKRLPSIAGLASASLVAVALLIAPALAEPAARAKARGSQAVSRSVASFTPAASDPRLAAMLARRGGNALSGFRFTPAATAADRSRAVRVAVRARATTPAEAARSVLAATSESAVTAITPSTYNLGVSLGWQRFALSTDIAQSDGGILPGRRDSARLGMSYRANRRLTGRVAVAAERAEGNQRIIADDEAYSLDVGGAFTIARNIDLTGGVRYRIARDRLEPLQRDERRDSQAVYVGTAFRF